MNRWYALITYSKGVHASENWHHVHKILSFMTILSPLLAMFVGVYRHFISSFRHTVHALLLSDFSVTIVSKGGGRINIKMSYCHYRDSRYTFMTALSLWFKPVYLERRYRYGPCQQFVHLEIELHFKVFITCLLCNRHKPKTVYRAESMLAPTNERRRYQVTSFLIGWAQA